MVINEGSREKGNFLFVSKAILLQQDSTLWSSSTLITSLASYLQMHDEISVPTKWKWEGQSAVHCSMLSLFSVSSCACSILLFQCLLLGLMRDGKKFVSAPLLLLPLSDYAEHICEVQMRGQDCLVPFLFPRCGWMGEKRFFFLTEEKITPI